MKKVLVTGGAGFIGSNLCSKLLQTRVADIYSLDNYFTGDIQNHVEGVTYVEGNTKDISNTISFKPDIIFHLGEYSRVEQSFDDIDQLWDSNVTGTRQVLEFARQNSAKIIYAGSSTKFSSDIDYNESPYAWVKATNTQLVNNYAKWFGIDYAITYFYNVYGQNEISKGKYATVIALFTEKMRNGEPIPVVSPGTQTRNFTHINDIIDGLILVGEKGQGDGYGIGHDQEHSILEVAKMFNDDIAMLPERRGNRNRSELVNKKTKDLGWTAKVSLQDYINDLKKST